MLLDFGGNVPDNRAIIWCDPSWEWLSIGTIRKFEALDIVAHSGMVCSDLKAPRESKNMNHNGRQQGQETFRDT